MSIAQKFERFCSTILISRETVEDISMRYKQITKQLNKDFWGDESEIANSLYVGSYGRDTDIVVSDIDVIMSLPWKFKEQYDNYAGNGQSALLQAIKNSLKNRYPNTNLRGDGQVVQINFSDGIKFEIVPAFLFDTGRYLYPDTNNGGSWKVTNPRAEIIAIKEANNSYNRNLKRLCRMMRAWKDKWEVSISGLLIDTLAYDFFKTWEFRKNGFVYYDWLTRDFFRYLKDQDPSKPYWQAPGSYDFVYRTGSFEYKALQCYNISLKAIEYEREAMPYSANEQWVKIYGVKFKND